MKQIARSFLVSAALCAASVLPAHAELDVPNLKAAIEKSLESRFNNFRNIIGNPC
jgi:hippurate hydrolase